MESERLTPPQLQRLQHATGFNRLGQAKFTEGSRNHFCGEDAACRELVALGYMATAPGFPSALSGGEPVFTVTQAGRAAMIAQTPKPPKKTRERLRYERWLDLSDVCDVSFGEFLRRGMYREDYFETLAGRVAFAAGGGEG